MEEESPVQKLHFEHVFIKEEPKDDAFEEGTSDVAFHQGSQTLCKSIKEELEVYNTQEDIEFSAECVKPEAIWMEESQENEGVHNQKLNAIEDAQNISGELCTLKVEESIENDNHKPNAVEDVQNDSSELSILKVMAPCRTYQRSTSNRKRLCPWDTERRKETGQLKAKKLQVKESQVTKFVNLPEKKTTCTKNENKTKKDPNNKKVKDAIKKCLHRGKSIKQTKSNMKITTKATVLIDVRTGNRVKVTDSRHACLYCRQRFKNMQSHFIKSHSEESEVSSVRYKHDKSRKKLLQLIRLMRIGDFQHNARVLVSNIGDLIVLRPSERYVGICDKKHFIPCPDCAAFVFKTYLKRHQQLCVLKSNFPRKLQSFNRNLFRESCSMLTYNHYSGTKVDCSFKENALNRLTSTIGNAAKNDEIIVLLGQYITLTNNSKDMSVRARKAMYKMGCLLLSCRRLTEQPNLMLTQLFTLENLTLLMNTIKTLLSSRNEGLNMLDLYKELCPLIVACIFILRGKYLVEGNVGHSLKILQFYYLFIKAWECEITGVVQVNTCSNRFLIKEEILTVLPIISGVKSLKESLTSKMVMLTSDIKMQCNEEHIENLWSDLAETTVCVLCLFNPVDFAVIQGIKISEYAVRPDRSIDSIEDYENNMTKISYYLAAKRFIMTTRYFGTDSVILFDSEVKKAIDVLIKKRMKASICLQNPYIFATPYSMLRHMKAVNCFYTLCVQSGKLNNDAMKSMMKRKFISFITHISDASSDEMEWIRNYLQVSSIEKTFVETLQMYEVYKMFVDSNKELEDEITSVIETPTKVMENLKQGDFNDKTEKISENVSQLSSSNVQWYTESEIKADASLIQPELDKTEEVSEKVSHLSSSNVQRYTKSKIKADATFIQLEIDKTGKISEKVSQLSSLDVKRCIKIETKVDTKLTQPEIAKLQTKRCWSALEKHYIVEYFKSEIKNEKIPGKEKCLQCLSKRKVLLNGRTWESIKKCVVFEIERRKEILVKNNPLFCDLD